MLRRWNECGQADIRERWRRVAVSKLGYDDAALLNECGFRWTARLRMTAVVFRRPRIVAVLAAGIIRLAFGQRADAREPFYIELELGNQKVWVIRAQDGELYKGVSLNPNEPNVTGLIRFAFVESLTQAGIKADQILLCDNRDCRKLFVSSRKPRGDRKAHYCSIPCCHLESTRRQREEPGYKEQERKRSNKRYRTKVLGK